MINHLVDVAIPILDKLTALDAVGPYEVLSRLPDARVRFVAAEAGPKRTETRMLALQADLALSELTEPDIAGDEIAQAIQLGIEYDPEPPFESGSVAKTSPGIVQIVKDRRAQLA